MKTGTFNEYEQCLSIVTELFAKDFLFYLATSKVNIPSVRAVDTCYCDEAFWIVTYSNTKKIIDIESNPNASLASSLYSFKGKAFNFGHPLKEGNQKIKEQLIEVFKDWYFLHCDEKHEHMCYIKFIPESGFFHKDGVGYRVSFSERKVEKFVCFKQKERDFPLFLNYIVFKIYSAASNFFIVSASLASTASAESAFTP